MDIYYLEFQIESVVSLFTQWWFLMALLVASWSSMGFWLFRHHRNGPKIGPTVPGNVSFGGLGKKMSEEEIFRILTTTEVNIQIVRICETPRTAREIAKALGDVYPGHREKGFPADKLGEHLANLERLAAVKFNGERWEATDVGVKMVRKYFG